MKFLNIGCGAMRPPYNEECGVPKHLIGDINTPWLNMDTLRDSFKDPLCLEMVLLSKEFNYIEHDLRKPMPFLDGHFDGILASHVLEHLDLQETLVILNECKRVLKDGGVLRISVPDAERFYSLSLKEKIGPVNWGEPGREGVSFMRYALFFEQHKQVFSKQVLFCYLLETDFSAFSEVKFQQTICPGLADLDNRERFSLFVEAVK
jgi:predicted SAM-dependent methyltransferase